MEEDLARLSPCGQTLASTVGHRDNWPDSDHITPCLFPQRSAGPHIDSGPDARQQTFLEERRTARDSSSRSGGNRDREGFSIRGPWGTTSLVLPWLSDKPEASCTNRTTSSLADLGTRVSRRLRARTRNARPAGKLLGSGALCGHSPPALASCGSCSRCALVMTVEHAVDRRAADAKQLSELGDRLLLGVVELEQMLLLAR